MGLVLMHEGGQQDCIAASAMPRLRRTLLLFMASVCICSNQHFPCTAGGQELLQPDNTANPLLSRFISFMAEKAVNRDMEVPNALEDRLVRLLAEPRLNTEAKALLKAMAAMFPTHIPKVSKPKCSMFPGCSQKVQSRVGGPAPSSASHAGSPTRVTIYGNRLSLVCCRPRQRRRS